MYLSKSYIFILFHNFIIIQRLQKLQFQNQNFRKNIIFQILQPIYPLEHIPIERYMTSAQQKQASNAINSILQKIQAQIQQMFKYHHAKVQKMNQQKAFGGKNSKHDRSDKVYQNIAQLQVKIRQGIFKSIKQSQCLRKQRKQFFQNKMGKFVQILRQLQQKKNLKIKINQNLEKLVAQATTTAQQATSILKKFEKGGTGWCGKTSDFKIPLQKILTNLAQYQFLFENLNKFQSITNDSVKQIFLPVDYNEKEFTFVKNQLIKMWPKPQKQIIQIVKQIPKKQDPKPVVSLEVSRLDQAHELLFGFTRPQQPYKAIKIYEQQIKKNVNKASAFNALGMIYQTGKYVSKDLKKALKYYKEGQKLNSPQSLHRIGFFLQKGLINSKQQFQGKYSNREAQIRAGIAYYEKAAKLGHLDAITDLGFIYQNGIKNQNGEQIIPASAQHAIDYYKRAKKQDFPRALNNLGSFLIKNDKFLSGTQVQNVQKGIKYLKKAKQLKYPKAFLNLGKCYENGIGQIQSIDKARACYLQGVDAGEYTCKMQYIRTFITQKIDDNKVMIKLAQLCRQVLLKDQSNPQANYFMGLFCQKGIGTQKNKQSSFYYIEKAARRNHPAALVKLGDYYYSGYYVQKNYEYAKKLYDLARQQGNTQAMLNIGLMKQKKLIDDENNFTPQEVFQEAAKQGNPNAMLYAGMGKGIQQQRQSVLKAAENGCIQAVQLLKKTDMGWIPKKPKQVITHAQWNARKTSKIAQTVLNYGNQIRPTRSRISVNKQN